MISYNRHKQPSDRRKITWKSLLVCATVKEMLKDGETPIKGSVCVRCTACDTAMWASPATVELQKKHQAAPFCWTCALDETKDSAVIAAELPSSEQIKELEDHDSA